MLQKNLLPPFSSFSSNVLKMEVSCFSGKLVLKYMESHRKRTPTSQTLLRGSCILKVSFSFPAARFTFFKMFNINEVKWSRYRPGVAQRWVEVSLYSFMTTALEGGEWPAARLGRTLPPGKARYPFYMRLGRPQDRSGGAENLVHINTRINKLGLTCWYSSNGLVHHHQNSSPIWTLRFEYFGPFHTHP